MGSEDEAGRLADPKVSVVITTYNRAGLVLEAIQSCLMQTLGSVEILVVDDGSTDGTAAVVEAMRRTPHPGKMISYWWKANGGPSSARQFGLKRARGTYLQFLDSDDLLRPEKLELQVGLLERAGPNAGLCLCLGRTGSIGAGWDGARQTGPRAASPEEFLRELCSPSDLAMTTLSQVWRRDFLLAGPEWSAELRWGEDWVYGVRQALRMERLVRIDEHLFWARDHCEARLTNADFGASDEPRAIANAQAMMIVAREVGASAAFDRSCRAGMLGLAKQAYLLLLDSDQDADIRRFETFVAEFARGSGTAFGVRAACAVRPVLGRRTVRALARAVIGARRTLRRLR